MKDIQSLTDNSIPRNDSVTALLGFLSLYRKQPSATLWAILYEQSNVTANRIIYHAQFALDHLTHFHDRRIK